MPHLRNPSFQSNELIEFLLPAAYFQFKNVLTFSLTFIIELKITSMESPGFIMFYSAIGSNALMANTLELLKR